jgi:hypothetical protein
MGFRNSGCEDHTPPHIMFLLGTLSRGIQEIYTSPVKFSLLVICHGRP